MRGIGPGRTSKAASIVRLIAAVTWIVAVITAAFGIAVAVKICETHTRVGDHPSGRSASGRCRLLPSHTTVNGAIQPPIMRPKPYGEPFMFRVQSLLREGRRQRG